MREYMTTRDIVGPLLLIESVTDVTYGELVELEFPDGTRSLGNVLEVNQDVARVQAFEGTRGSNPSQTKVRFLGRSLELGVSRDMLGRVFDGLGRPADVTLAPFYAAEKANDEQRIVGVGVSLPLPLWHQNRGNIEAASAREQQAEASLRATQREIERRVAERTSELTRLNCELAVAKLGQDDREGYREACSKMLAKFGETHPDFRAELKKQAERLYWPG